MKRWLMALGLLVMVGGRCWAATNQDNTARKGVEVAPFYSPVDERQVIRFWGAVAGNTATLAVGTMTASNFTLSPSMNYSTGAAVCGLVSSTGTQVNPTYGGRAYVKMWATQLSSAQVVGVDISSVLVSTATSPAMVGPMNPFTFDEPFAWQGPIYVKSSATFTLNGIIYMMKPRTN